MNNQKMIHSILDRELFYFTFSASMNVPYIICDPETCNDQVWLFAGEEDMRAFYKKKKEQKVPLAGKRCEKRAYGTFLEQLHLLGVNELVWVDGDQTSKLDLETVIAEVTAKPQRKGISDPTLQLSMIYFLQEMRRPITMEEHLENGVRALEEEMLKNICKGQYYLILRTDKEHPGQTVPLLVQTQEGENTFTLLPAFTDVSELSKAGQRNQGLRVITVPFVKFKDLLPDEVHGITINPYGANCVLRKEDVLNLIG